MIYLLYALYWPLAAFNWAMDSLLELTTYWELWLDRTIEEQSSE